ncbi:MAG: carbohydrate ABC transporter permease [Paenibacillaceae bacterium]|nr:carbohydrate ABC transporter permease [Paenibacillaceae bacterium]
MQPKVVIKKSMLYIVQAVLLVIFGYPFFLLIINSFKSLLEIFENPVALPTTYSFDQIATAFENMNFGTTFVNSLLITVVSVSLILFFSAMAAHFMVRNDTKTNKILFFLLVFSMIIPFQVVMIPINIIYGGVLGFFQDIPFTILIALYVGFGSALAVVIYHGFVKSIPYELEEAAQIDGCSRIGVFFRIVLPIMLPTSVTIAILTVLWIWNDYLLPSLILTKSELYTMPIQIKVFSGEYQNDWALLIPAMLLTILPVIAAYIFGQKYIIRGVMQGAIK